MRIAGLAAASILLAGCASMPTGGPAGCDNADGALDNAAFVIATAPAAVRHSAQPLSHTVT